MKPKCITPEELIEIMRKKSKKLVSFAGFHSFWYNSLVTAHVKARKSVVLYAPSICLAGLLRTLNGDSQKTDLILMARPFFEEWHEYINNLVSAEKLLKMGYEAEDVDCIDRICFAEQDFFSESLNLYQVAEKAKPELKKHLGLFPKLYETHAREVLREVLKICDRCDPHWKLLNIDSKADIKAYLNGIFLPAEKLITEMMDFSEYEIKGLAEKLNDKYSFFTKVHYREDVLEWESTITFPSSDFVKKIEQAMIALKPENAAKSNAYKVTTWMTEKCNDKSYLLASKHVDYTEVYKYKVFFEHLGI